MKQSILSFLILLFVGTGLEFSQVHAQGLQRRGRIGIQLIPLNDSIAASRGIDAEGGIVVKGVMPNSTAEEVGLEAEDIIVGMNDFSIKNLQQLGQAMQVVRAGEKVAFTVYRGKKEKVLKGKMLPRPYETSEVGEVIYDEAAFKGGQLRTIAVRPKGKDKVPTVFFIPGYTCATVDNLNPLHPYRQLLDNLNKMGVATFRVEKSGMGDCMDTPDCFQMDYQTEVAGFNAGYEKMLEYDWVDKENIIVLGHSLGGLTAPLVASRYKPKGVVVYGTVHHAWSEYLLNMLRFQNPILGDPDFVAHEEDMRLYRGLLYEAYDLEKSPKELAKNPDYARLLKRDFQWDGEDMLLARHYKFWIDVHKAGITKAWTETPSYVLSIYGGADIQALNPTSHKTIARIVNHYQGEGRAKYVYLPDTDHSMIEIGDFFEVQKVKTEGKYGAYLRDNFSQKLMDELESWIKDIQQKRL